MKSLDKNGQVLVHHLRVQGTREKEQSEALARAEKINIVGAGGALTAAYEQLRNAAENTEEHLLLQNAIRRFYRQLFITRDEELIARSGNELAIELTLAGYLPNDHLTRTQVDAISELAKEHYSAYERIQADRALATDRPNKWALDVLAVKVERLLNDHGREAALVEFAYSEFESTLTAQATLGRETQDFGALLFIALQRALLKHNEAAIRASLIERYAIPLMPLDKYIAFNKQLDTLIDAPDADKLFHIIDRLVPPLRILRRMIDEQANVPELLESPDNFLDTYEKQVTNEYERVGRRINRAIVRSIIFLIITKFLIGIAIEVPYDLWAHGEIIWLPLAINLLFPPIYMFALRATHQLPGHANTMALTERMESMLYGNENTLKQSVIHGRSHSAVFSVMYGLMSIIVFGAVTYGLVQLKFSFVHILIFFLFLSAASFLGFRLSRLIREIEVVRSAQNGMTFIRDILYLPFVVVGRWMSDKYARVNVVAIVLDMLIELPLKTVLRLIRQWSAFIDERKDNI